MLEHKVDINVIAIIEAKIVNRILSWSPANFAWKANPKHARDLIAWAGPTLGTAATTKTMRNALDELPWERAKAVSSAGGTATYLAMDRPDIAIDVVFFKTRCGFIECTRVRDLRDDFWWSTWYSQQEHLQ